MKRYIVCLAVMAFVVLRGNFAFAGPDAKVQHVKSELGLTTVTVEGTTYAKVSLPNTILTTTTGAPELPMQMVYLVIPKDQKVEGINIVSAVPEDLPGTFNIYPAQPALPMGEPVPSFTPPNSKTYSSLEPYPGKLVEITGDGYMGGYHIVSLLVYPVQHIPA